MVKQWPCVGEWRFEATAGRVPWLRSQVQDVLATAGVDLDAVALAVTEAITNVVRHAYPLGEAGDVQVTVALDGEQAVVSVQDFGVGSAGFGSSPNRGMGVGLRIIRSSAAKVRIEPGETGTLVVMGFSLEG